MMQDTKSLRLSLVEILHNAMAAHVRGELNERELIAVTQAVNVELSELRDEGTFASYAPFAKLAADALSGRLAELDKK